MKKLALVLSLILLFLTINLQAQSFGGHPLGLHWQILTTDAVRVIYPKGMEAQAQRIASIINYMDINNRMSIGEKKRRFDMVLQNQTTNPNGYVGLAPLRSEFFATPPQNNVLLGSMDWLDVLAIHEYRHVQQNLNGLRGLTKLFYFLAGEGAWAAFHVISVPNWYAEGDAVITETALTNSGRGRSPFFTLRQRALAYAGKDYSYLKHRNGSYKSLLPNHYPLGYMLLTKARKEGGNNVTKTIHDQASAYRGIIYPFSKATKRNIGMSTTQLYNAAWAEKKEDWKKEREEADLIPTNRIRDKDERTVTNYDFPRVLPNGNIVVRKRSFKRTTNIYLLEGDTEKKLTTVGINADGYLSYGGGYLAWTENGVDIRRGNKDFSDILLYNMENGKRIRLTKKTKYFSPAVSPDGKTVAAIHISPLQENRIHVLDVNTGYILRKLDNPKNYVLSRAVWTEDGKSIVSVVKENSKIALMKFDLSESTMTQLSPWTEHTMSGPSIRNGQVYFNASFSGIDNIFVTDLTGSQELRQITSVPVGAFEPDVSPDGKRIVFTEFTDMGMVLSQQDLNESEFRKVNIVEPVDMAQFETVANKEEGGNILEKFEPANYSSKKYKGLFRGIKLHTWGFTPSIAVPALNLGFTNILNDLTLSVGGGINRNEDDSNFYNASLTIGRYFPEFTLNGNLSERSADYYTTGDSIDTQSFREQLIGGSVSVPFNWLHGNYFTSLRPTVGLNFRDVTNVKAGVTELPDNNFGAYNLGLSFRSLRRRAFQNVGPRGGVIANVAYTQSLEDMSNEKINFSGSLYAPGLMANHNLKISGAYQKELLTNSYQFADQFVYVRGYNSPDNDEFSRLSIDYGLPLLYPDFGIAGIIYFKRIRANLFFDYGVGKFNNPDAVNTQTSTNYSSVGAELIFDNVFLNLGPASFGLRQSFLLDKDPIDKDRTMHFEVFVGLGI